MTKFVSHAVCCVLFVAGVLKGTKESVAKTRMFTTGVAVRIRKGCGLSTANLVIPHHFTARRGWGDFVAQNSLLLERNDSGLLLNILIYQIATDQNRDEIVIYSFQVAFPSQVYISVKTNVSSQTNFFKSPTSFFENAIGKKFEISQPIKVYPKTLTRGCNAWPLFLKTACFTSQPKSMESSRSLKISHLEEGTRRESTDLGNICKNCDLPKVIFLKGWEGSWKQRSNYRVETKNSGFCSKRFFLKSSPDRFNRHLFLCLYWLYPDSCSCFPILLYEMTQDT